MAEMNDSAIDTAILQIDPAYQRCVVEQQVRWITQHYDPISFGRVLVGKRPDGGMYVVDGQQRLTAARRLGMTKVPCDVFASRGQEHEAAIFGEMNSHRTPVRPMDNFKADLVAGDPIALAIQSLVTELGYRITNNSSTPTNWAVLRSVATIRGIVRKGGIGLLRQTLEIISESWEGETQATHNMILQGVSHFLQKADGNPNFSRARLVERLQQVGPVRIMREVKDSSKMSGGHNHPNLVTSCILKLYNNRLRGRHRLILPGMTTETSPSNSSEEAGE